MTPQGTVRLMVLRRPGILFASATRTSVSGLRASSPLSQMPGCAFVCVRRLMPRLWPDDEQPPERALAQPCCPPEAPLSARAMLSRHEPEPSLKVARSAERLRRRPGATSMTSMTSAETISGQIPGIVIGRRAPRVRVRGAS